MELHFETWARGGADLHGLGQSRSGAVYAVSRQTGEVLQVDEESSMTPPFALVAVASTGGVPSGIAFDDDGVGFVTDVAHQAVLTLTRDVSAAAADQDGGAAPVDSVAEFVREYEEKQFLGPNSLVFDKDGTLYFTDSGPPGETTLADRKGSVFSVTADGQLLRPLALSCLAHPSGLALSKNHAQLFVAETLANRVLRYVQRPAGVFHASVFVQLAGGLGPTALATDPDTGNLFVGHFDFAAEDADDAQPGRVSVFSPAGKLLAEVDFPAPEITAMAVLSSSDGKHLYVTEATTCSIYRAKLPEAM